MRGRTTKVDDRARRAQAARDERAARRTERRLRALRARPDPGWSEWEARFLEGAGSDDRGVPERVERYGRAFRDPALGEAGQALSRRQKAAVRSLEAKARRGRGSTR